MTTFWLKKRFFLKKREKKVFFAKKKAKTFLKGSPGRPAWILLQFMMPNLALAQTEYICTYTAGKFTSFMWLWQHFKRSGNFSQFNKWLVSTGWQNVKLYQSKLVAVISGNCYIIFSVYYTQIQIKKCLVVIALFGFCQSAYILTC